MIFILPSVNLETQADLIIFFYSVLQADISAVAAEVKPSLATPHEDFGLKIVWTHF